MKTKTKQTRREPYTRAAPPEPTTDDQLFEALTTVIKVLASLPTTESRIRVLTSAAAIFKIDPIHQRGP